MGELKDWALFRAKDCCRLSVKGYLSYKAINESHAIEQLAGDLHLDSLLYGSLQIIPKKEKCLDGYICKVIYADRFNNFGQEYWVVKPKEEAEKDIYEERYKTKNL